MSFHYTNASHTIHSALVGQFREFQLRCSFLTVYSPEYFAITFGFM